MLKHFSLILSTLMILGASAVQGALTAGDTYTVNLHKQESNGTLSGILATTTAVADDDGKIDFTFDDDDVPFVGTDGNEDLRFLVIKILDSNDSEVRSCLLPAPTQGNVVRTGVNSLTTAQAGGLLALAENGNGTDDPIVTSFMNLMTRSPDISTADQENIATVVYSAIVGTSSSNGMINYIRGEGVSEALLDEFREKMLSNPTPGAVDLADFYNAFRNAVESDDADSAKELMSKAGGALADVYISAASTVGIELGLILAGFDSAGEIVNSLPEFSAIEANAQSSMEQAANGFFTRLAAAKVQREYSDAIGTLGGTGEQVNRFNDAVATLLEAFETIDTTYADYFQDPEQYLSDNSTTHQAVQQAINAAYESGFQAFKTGIRATDAEITAMRQNIANGLAVAENQSAADILASMPADVGVDYDFDALQDDPNADTVNWPIPKVVAINFVASILEAGGSFNYTRDDTAVPAIMNWLNGQRTDFTSAQMDIPNDFASLLGLEEDVVIVQFTKFNLYNDPNNPPTPEQEITAEDQFIEHLIGLKDNITGTTDGSMAITGDMMKALIRLMLEPNLN